MKLLFAATVAVACITSTTHAQDAVAGATVFKKCMSCHAVGEGAKNKVGPELNGVIGRPVASISGYNYSAAMKGSGLTWDEATLIEFLKGPKALVPGTKMAFAGLKTDADIANVVAYLKQFAADSSGTPAP
ncbi:MAG: cytochrome c family protein [Devosia sp.]|uniref:c-type cytochrome n=1 Tax=Devosia sp. TaxID=1871048 RepID=UPI001AD37FFB|nr:cytochrome c family protein [Devosia sp.]MBN9317864.1 cytochrome c family protein [Devosia sp.]